jgi:hypothetical protein
MTDAGGFASGADNVSTLSQLAPGANGNAGINTEEETEPGKTKIKYGGKGYAWTEEEDDALLKGAGKYGMDFKRIKKEDDGKVLAYRNPSALRARLRIKYPAKYEELRAADPIKTVPAGGFASGADNFSSLQLTRLENGSAAANQGTFRPAAPAAGGGEEKIRSLGTLLYLGLFQENEAVPNEARVEQPKPQKIDMKTPVYAHASNMQIHKANKHDIDVHWYPCDQDGCHYKAKRPVYLRRHKKLIHDPDAQWYRCDQKGCDFKTKRLEHVKRHRESVHDIGVQWTFCPEKGCNYKCKQKFSLKSHTWNMHSLDNPNRKKLTAQQLERSIKREKEAAAKAALPRRKSGRRVTPPSILDVSPTYSPRYKWSNEEDSILIESSSLLHL